MRPIDFGKRVAWMAAVGVCIGLIVPTAGTSALPPLVIAVEGPQSDAQAPNGLDQLRGVRLAVSQLDAHGGLWDGRKVVVYAADDKADAANAKAVALVGASRKPDLAQPGVKRERRSAGPSNGGRREGHALAQT